MGSKGLNVCRIFSKLKIAKYFKPLTRLCLLFSGIVIYSILITTAQANESLFGRPVAEIEVLGNAKTQARFVIKWARIEIGQPLNQAMLDLVRQRIHHRELFEEVTVNAVASGDKVKIVITLVEKRYTLVLPRLSRNSDGDIKVGLQLSMDNINGGDQSLRVRAERGESSTGEESSRYRVGYRIPQYSRPYEYHMAFGQDLKKELSTFFTERNVAQFIKNQ